MANTTRKRLLSCHLSWTTIWRTEDHKIEQALCPFLLGFFCFGGCRTTLMAASKTAFTFWIQRLILIRSWYKINSRTFKDSNNIYVPFEFWNYILCKLEHQWVFWVPHPSEKIENQIRPMTYQVSKLMPCYEQTVATKPNQRYISDTALCY